MIVFCVKTKEITFAMSNRATQMSRERKESDQRNEQKDPNDLSFSLVLKIRNSTLTKKIKKGGKDRGSNSCIAMKNQESIVIPAFP